MNAPDRTGAMTVQLIPQPYLLFLGDTVEPAYAKTAFGLRDWAPDNCVGEFACANATVSVGLPPMRPAEAHAAGAKSLVIGVANNGGIIHPSWLPLLVEALEAGLDVVSGLHASLGDVPELRAAAQSSGRRLIDVRRPPADIPVGTGLKRTGRRLLTVGTDCALGKKYTALAISRAFAARGIDSDFRASGQTGILLAGRGMPMDAVPADFEAGAAEILSPAAAPGHWDVIEGQGSLLHPSYAAVSLGLLHGSQPDVVVVCHQPDRPHMLGLPDFPVPSIERIIDVTLELGRVTNPGIRCAGVSLNTAHLDEGGATRLMASESERLGLPCADPIRGGIRFEELVDRCLA
ncbi:putative NAD-dependent epimerase/dehydratase family protein [Sphingomonas sp. UYAg733]